MIDKKNTAIILIHGLWLTPRSWESFRAFYEGRGYNVLTPAWPRIHGEVEDVRRDPSALAGLGVLEIADHYEQIVKALDGPPIIMGHSFGGLIVQILLDRGLGAAGVGIDAAAPKGVFRLPFSALKAASGVLSNPANYRRVPPFTFEQFRYAFANNISEKQARTFYERYAIPGPGRPIFQVATANLNPDAATKVNFGNNTRAPLLLIAGSEDHQVPVSMVRENFKRYARSTAVTEFKEFPKRSHLIAIQDGWQEVAEYALTWAETKAGGGILQKAA
jgi:pimeloyl-ACP methyl ester carboxylesterase